MNSIYLKLFIYKLKMLYVYRKDFFIGILSSIIKALIGIIFIESIFNNVTTINGWNQSKLVYLYFSVSYMQAIYHMLFMGMIGFSDLYIKNGELDCVLIKPVNPLKYIIAYDISIKEMPAVIINLLVLIVTIKKLTNNTLDMALLILLPHCGMLIMLWFSIFINCLSFRYYDTLMGVKFIVAITDFCRYPMNIYPKFISYIATFIVPYGLVTFYPLKDVTKLKSYFYMVLALVVCLGFIAYRVWERSLNNYQSVGS
ncbi:MAG TPA: ABC-2 family transporter protein [Tissierellales bacterium]|nr:ABC-2 family transporter protein [Tissierellales bacterium]